ncbi:MULTISPECIES: ABC transporter substrate-binding protein [Cupriavidus]|uniref:ABC transporter permease n=1 Tax=Cupriavidus metallidurans TaxID=119219 RepID=A0A2L0XBE2_9BURK|nr:MULTISPECIES: ABC transporter substrate-binding protein [Cupriavidus]AVA37428.1 ABC transporter permease [Cupriavidus metallidurans]KWR85958.1 ABC transporter permease [Cupriavidus sp. SHE]QBP11432.1 ABC transporter permease [Cupriavidus metallidurans]QWC88489.1 ABC transporter substrate-binding protein [Cupriavidus metallidurans]
MRQAPPQSISSCVPASAGRRRSLGALGALGSLGALSSLAGIAPQTAFAQPAPSGARRQLVVGQLVDRTGPQADLSRDYLAGAKVLFDAYNASNGSLRIVHVARDADTNPRGATAQAVALADSEHAEVLFGPGDALLPALAASTELSRRGVQIVAPLSGLSLNAENVWFTRADYQSELDAAVRQLRGFGLTAVTLAVSPDFAAGTLAAGTPWLSRLEKAMSVQTVPLTGNFDESARRIAAGRPGAVIVGGDTLAYGSLGRALAAQNWYGFLVGLSAVSPLSAREILGTGYAGGMVVTQIAPGPQESTLRVVKEHVARMKQYLDEPPSPATLAGYIGAAWLVRAASGTKAPGPVELRRALQTRVDVGDFTLDFTRGLRGSQYVQLAPINKSGVPQRA